MTSLAELLGYDAGDRLLVVCCDDLGFSYSANAGVYQSLREGIATSASLMVPAPWARGAAAQYRGEDVGAHLTLNAEHDLYRWGPITLSPSLLDGDGGFPRTVEDIWEHADLDEVRREWRAQVERAIYWGFDVSHLDVHLPGIELKAEFFDVYLDLAEDLALPVRLPSQDAHRQVGFPFRDLAAERGVLAPDQVVSIPGEEIDAKAVLSALGALRPGVAALHLSPAIDTAELRASAPDWRRRVSELSALTDPALRDGILESGVRLVSYRAIREAMRQRGRFARPFEP